jgi:hypothetical protein
MGQRGGAPTPTPIKELIDDDKTTEPRAERTFTGEQTTNANRSGERSAKAFEGERGSNRTFTNERPQTIVSKGEQTIAANETLVSEPRASRGGERTFIGEQTANVNRSGNRGGNRTFAGERAESQVLEGEPRTNRGTDRSENRTFASEQAANVNRGEKAETPHSDESHLLTPKVEQSEKADIEAQKAYEFFVKNIDGGYSTVTMQLPKAGESIFNFNYALKNPQHSRATNQMQVDMKTEEIVKHIKYDDKTLGEKFMSSIFSLHSGDFFGGVVGLSLYFLSSLAVVLFTVTGYMLYYKRSLKRKFKGKRNK